MLSHRFISIKTQLKFILIVGAFLMSYQTLAQSFRGIITSGANACQIDGDNLSGFHKPGYMFGIGVERSLYKHWSVLLGIEFMEKGSRTSSKDSVLYFKWKMQYIDIPLVLSFKAHQRFRFQLGITPSVLVNEKIDIGYGYQTPPFKDDAFNVLIAPAVEFFPLDNVSLLLRYQYSMIRFNSQVPNTIPKFHNLITVGLRFYFGEKNED
ncbi:MAG: outer membrane beta-barrel protein [Cytophagaceae bacterium]|nr:outer membrane beta-barrel protein [Cytophagaceae bacterium]